MAAATKRTKRASHAEAAAIEPIDTASSGFATAVITGIGVAVFAPELLPGMAIGVAAMLAPRILPTLGAALRPLVKTAVQGGYTVVEKTKELAAEAGEQLQDMAAEARAEQEAHRRRLHA